MEYDEWPNCAIEGCSNKCCLALDSIFCFPHTPGNKHVKHLKIDAKHPEACAQESQIEEERSSDEVDQHGDQPA